MTAPSHIWSALAEVEHLSEQHTRAQERARDAAVLACDEMLANGHTDFATYLFGQYRERDADRHAKWLVYEAAVERLPSITPVGGPR